MRYYEYENDKFEYLSEYKSGDPQRGVAFIPKRGVNLHENEVTRMYKTVNDAYIEPVSFIVPRRAEVFQNDIYPPATGTKPAMSAEEYFGGKEAAVPPKISLESLYEGQEPVEVPAEKVPSANKMKETPAPAVSSVTPAKQEPTPQRIETPPAASTSRGPQLSMKDNQQSMSAMADKFADKDKEDESSDDDSSFEEVPKPVERPAAAVATRQEEKTGVQTPPTQPSPTKTTSAPSPKPEPETVASPPPSASKQAPSLDSKTNGETDTAAASAAPRGAAASLKDVLQDIKAMLSQQSAQIEALTKEVAGLKERLGEQ